MLKVLSADDTTTTSASSSTDSEVETSNHSTIDAAVMNTSISWSFKQHGKSNQTQTVEARCKILKTANTLLSKANQESTSVKICDKQDDPITKKVKEKIEHLDQLYQVFSKKL